jgi:type I restriction enzyme S subunit
MKRGWGELPLGQAPLQIIDGDRGKTYPKHGDFSDDGYCLFLSAANVTSSGFDFSECQFISEQKDDQLRKGRLSRHDVVLTTRGTLGNTALYGDDVPYDHVRINSGMVIMRTDPMKLLPAFLYGFLRSPGFEGQVEQLRSGVAQPQLPIRDINKIKLPLPSKAVQERIVDVFSAYDDLIENNRRRMALLEEAARQLYREWFVRLRFPGHEHTRITNGVPEGWEESAAFSAMEVLSGGTPKTTEPDYWDGEIPFYTPKDATDTCYVRQTERAITELGLKNCNSRLYETDTVFISARGTVGNLNLASCPMAMSQSCYALIGKGHISQLFLFCGLKEAVEHFKQHAVGAVFDAIVVDTFKLIPFVVPDEKKTRHFEEAVAPMFRQVANLMEQNDKLSAARDLLLPRLMSGEIVV